VTPDPLPRGGRALEVDGVRLRLGVRTVLDGVGLRVESGEVVGLLGPNGAGKTSLLRVVSRSLVPDAGTVHIGDRPIEEMGRRELARAIAMVPQDTTVPFNFRVGELVLMGRAPHQSRLGLDGPGDVARARAALEWMGIADLADRPVLELSGGERQLVMFARALVQDPDWLLLDEPTAFLDLRHRIHVLSTVRQLAAEGRGALVVSHDLGLAARVCDRLILLTAGRVAAAGPPREVVRPDVLREAFGIEADVLEVPGGGRVVVPRLAAAPAPAEGHPAADGDHPTKAG